jgi:hypothetical protein
MNKKLIAIAVAGAMFAPLAAQAEGATVSGFADIIYTGTNDADTTSEGLFGATGEVDAMGKVGDVAVRLDVNLDLSASNSADIEQAFFAAPMGPVTLIGGVFNSPLTADSQDAPDMNYTSHSAVYNVAKNAATDQMAGIAFAGAAGPANVTLAFVNDPGSDAGTGGGDDNAMSVGFVVNGSVMDGLDAELGYFSQSDDTAKYANASGAGNITDINLTYTGIDMLRLGVDYAQAASVVDSVYSIDVGYDVGNGLTAALRYDVAAFENSAMDDTKSTTVSIGYSLSDNVLAILESMNGDNTSGESLTGVGDGTTTTLEFVATF